LALHVAAASVRRRLGLGNSTVPPPSKTENAFGIVTARVELLHPAGSARSAAKIGKCRGDGQGILAGPWVTDCRWRGRGRMRTQLGRDLLPARPEGARHRPSVPVRASNGAAALFGIRLALIYCGSTGTMRFPMSQAGSSFARMRPSMTVVAGILGATVWSATAFGADKVTFLTSWF